MASSDQSDWSSGFIILKTLCIKVAQFCDQIYSKQINILGRLANEILIFSAYTFVCTMIISNMSSINNQQK